MRVVHPVTSETVAQLKMASPWGGVLHLREIERGTRDPQTELIAFCREPMAHFKAPKRIIFTPLPKASTDKVQKCMLRKQLE
jgi:fatty-acyl-CoA synthase